MTPFARFVNDNIQTGNLIGAEIGVMSGVNAEYLLQALPIKKLYLVDNYKPYWDGGTGNYDQIQMHTHYGNAIAKMDSYFDRTQFIVLDSYWAAEKFPDNHFDFVYIDAGHTYDEVISDLNAWWPKVKKGGVFGGHDYGTINGAEVKRAVDDFLGKKDIPFPQKEIGMRVGEAMEWAIVKP